MGNETRIALEHKLNCCGLFNSTMNHAEYDSDMELCTIVRTQHAQLELHGV